jgi:hypothetical protein
MAVCKPWTCTRRGSWFRRLPVVLLEGKRLLITGVLTPRSITFDAARIAQEQGAQIVLTRAEAAEGYRGSSSSTGFPVSLDVRLLSAPPSGCSPSWASHASPSSFGGSTR